MTALQWLACAAIGISLGLLAGWGAGKVGDWWGDHPYRVQQKRLARMETEVR